MSAAALDLLREEARAWRPAATEWRAWYVFAASQGALDLLLARSVIPVVQELGGSADFFYLRYWENGPHLRLRFRGLEDDAFQAVGARLRESATAAATSVATPAEANGVSLAGWQPGETMVLLAAGTTVEVPYEPELRRYGGLHALKVNESLFDASSRLALAIVNKTADADHKRRTLAFYLTAAAIGEVVADRSGLCAFLEGMKQQWRSYLADPAAADSAALAAYSQSADEMRTLVARIFHPSSNSGSQPVVERWRQALALHFAELRWLAAEGLLIHPGTGIAPRDSAESETALQNILLSQIHMMNNRLGIAPQHEYHFAAVLELEAKSI